MKCPKDADEEKKLKHFFSGVVVALDVVAMYGEDTIFKEIVQSVGNGVTKEIKANGSIKCKKMLKSLAVWE